MKIFFSVSDDYPPYRVDVAELFGSCLFKRGILIEWYMNRKSPGPRNCVTFLQQNVHLPSKTSRFGLLGKLISRISFWLEDCFQLLKCLGKPIDIIQVRDKYISALFGLLVARVKKVKFVYWCSYPFPEHQQEISKQLSGMPRYFRKIQSILGFITLYKVVMRYADFVFVQSDQMKLDIEQYGVSAKKMFPIPMGVPERLLTWAKTRQVDVVPNRVIYLGTMTAVRQLHVLIEAFAIVAKKNPLAKLYMVGDGEHPYERESLELLVHRLGLGGSVTFTGFVPMDDAWAYAASAAVCVSPFAPSKVLNSASPTKLHEYMALGRPVVCNKHPEQTFVIESSGAGVCVDWGVQSFADAILWMLANPGQAEAMGAKGPDWIAANRTYPILADLVLSKYEEVLQVNK